MDPFEQARKLRARFAEELEKRGLKLAGFLPNVTERQGDDEICFTVAVTPTALMTPEQTEEAERKAQEIAELEIAMAMTEHGEDVQEALEILQDDDWFKDDEND